MKVGDLVYDASLGLNGVIFDVAYEAYDEALVSGQQRWSVLYEDGDVDEAYGSELEVINDNR
jgi:hypothetical protein